MSPDQLAYQLALARTLTHELVPGKAVDLELPHEYAVRDAYAESRDAHGNVAMHRAFRRLVELSVKTWRGLTLGDVHPELMPVERRDEPLPFNRDALRLLLDERVDWSDELGLFISARLRERRDRLEAERKNSTRASPSSATP